MSVINANNIDWARGRQNTVLESFQEIIPDGMLVVDENRQIVSWNQRFIDLWQLSDQLLREGDQRLLDVARDQVTDPDRFLDQIEYLYRNPEEMECGTELRLRDGRYLERYSKGLIDRSGARWGRIWFFRDITRRKRSDLALRESEARFFQVAEHMRPAALYMLSPDRQALHYASPASEGIFGLPNQVIYQGWPHRVMALVHPEDREALQARLGGQPPCQEEEFEYRIQRPDGAERWLRTLEFPIRDASGSVQTISGIVEDITERKIAEAKVWQLQSELSHLSRVTMASEMAAGLAHELKQPLGAIVTHTHATLRRLQAGEADSPAQRDSLDKILQQGMRAGDIVRRLRRFVTKSEPRLRPEDINRLVREAAAFLDMEVQQRDARLHLALRDPLPPVLADKIQIQQVVVNLVHNSLEALQNHPGPDVCRDIRITTDAPEPDLVEVTVTDTGPGLPETQRERLFQPFYTTKQHGTGLGLWISRSIVELHRGRLYADNRDHSGAVFCFTLPVAEENAGQLG